MVFQGWYICFDESNQKWTILKRLKTIVQGWYIRYDKSYQKWTILKKFVRGMFN